MISILRTIWYVFLHSFQKRVTIQNPEEKPYSLYDLHTGFPYSVQDEFREYVGPRNTNRYPRFSSFDLQVTRRITVPLGHRKLKALVSGFSTSSTISTRGMCRTTWPVRNLAAFSTTPGGNTAGNLFWSSSMRFNSSITFSLLFFIATGTALAQEMSLPPANEVVAQMLARDAQRQHSLEGYEGMRRYTLVNEHMRKRAEMLVHVRGDQDGTKHFEIVNETGWKAAQKHVLRKMLESEAETSRPEKRVKTRLSPDNYEFQTVGRETQGDRTVYAMDVTPKRREKTLFRGRIWVDTEDYALVRADGNPAKNPSIWTKSVHFVHAYQKSGPFWFPATTESVTEARLFGTTDLMIEYFDYKPNAITAPQDSVEVAQRGSRP
jgi:hypothetical protein